MTSTHPLSPKGDTIESTIWIDTSNGRFDILPKSDLNPSWKKEMTDLARQQNIVGKSDKPMLVIWNIDKATDGQLMELKKVIENFFSTVKPEQLMISGRRASAVADKAQILLHQVLTDKKSAFQPKTIITGGADGVDSVPLRILKTLNDQCPKIIGQFTPTPFARADVSSSHNDDPLPSLDEHFNGLTPGASPLCAVEHIGSIPDPSDSSFRQFLSVMEGQWEARDTHNSGLADACLAFLTEDPIKKRTGHDGTKATLNIFASGRYAHPFKGENGTPISNWEVEPDNRSPGVVEVNQSNCDSDTFVGYKMTGLSGTKRKRDESFVTVKLNQIKSLCCPNKRNEKKER